MAEGRLTIRYYPDEILKKLAPRKKVEKLLSSRMSVSRTALTFLDGSDFIDKKEVKDVALKVAKRYKEKYKDELDKGTSRAAAKESALNDKKLLVQRVQNAIVWQVSNEIKSQYQGERYRWLPSDAEEPRADHQLNYGKVFVIGEGEMPGEEPGCRCGMEILVRDKELRL